MAGWIHFAFVVVLLTVSPWFVAGKCSSKSVSTYSSSVNMAESNTAIIVTFQLECDRPKPRQLFAVVNDRVLPVAQESNGNSLEVSWIEENKKISVDDFKVNFYDEVGYSAYRKARRSGQAFDEQSLFSIKLEHKDDSRQALWVQSEFIVVVIFMLIWWYASNTKSKLPEL